MTCQDLTFSEICILICLCIWFLGLACHYSILLWSFWNTIDLSVYVISGAKGRTQKTRKEISFTKNKIRKRQQRLKDGHASLCGDSITLAWLTRKKKFFKKKFRKKEHRCLMGWGHIRGSDYRSRQCHMYSHLRAHVIVKLAETFWCCVWLMRQGHGCFQWGGFWGVDLTSPAVEED